MKSLRSSAAMLAIGYCLTVSADLEQGYSAFQRGDYVAAIAAWQPLAEAGDITAQFNLGQMYRLGKGVAADDQQAARWYAMAAQQGSAYAQHNLKLMARDGRISAEQYQAAIDQETAAAGQTPPPTPAPTTNPAATPPPASATPATGTAQDWLSRLDPQDYVVQLLATPTKDAVNTFLASNRASIEAPPARTTSIVRTNSKGQDWYVLLLGPFANEQGARAAVAELPPALRENQPWIRRVSAVKATVRN